MTRLALQPLSGEETAWLAAAMVGAERFPPEVQRLIADKAEGNPFFIEEVTKCLLETGALVRAGDGFALGRPASEIVVPDTIHGLIMARIDRLGDGPKRAIQVASVIGREFAVRLLQRAAGLGEGLERLMGEHRSLELIYGCTHVAVEATGVYWRPVWNEGRGQLLLANAAHVRVVPGRKSDVNDATWLADLLAHGPIRASFVPPQPTHATETPAA